MMTGAQFYLAIGLPIFSILLALLGSTVANNRAIGAPGQRIDELRSEMRSGRSEMRSALDDPRSEMKTGFEAVNHRLDRLETRFDRIEDEVRKYHEGRLSRLDARVFSRSV